jgi:two-component system NtrC family sensor kinase
VQLVLALGGALLIAFVPLYYAVATYTRLAFRDQQLEHARALGRAVAGQVVEAEARRDAGTLRTLLEAQVGGSIAAVALYGPDRRLRLGAGEVSSIERIEQELAPNEERVITTHSASGTAVAVTVPAKGRLAVILVRTDLEGTRFVPLVKLVALYMGAVALLLLGVAYMALTVALVRPMEALSGAARRVVEGTRRFFAPTTSVRELHELGTSVETMTTRLLEEEEALRRKVDEVENATAELRQAQAHLVRSEQLASVGRLAAGLAHEVGNPIAAIMGIQDLMLAGGLDAAEQKDFLQRMHKETERVNRIMRDLLQFARPKASGSDPGNVETAIHDTVTLVTPQKEFDRVELSLDVFPDLPLVRLAPEHLVQVLLNLLLNAAHACSTGGTVTLRAHKTESGVRVDVEDTGTGIPAQVRDRIFDPFFTTKEVGKGTGLGLSVCKGLIEATGGSIRLDREHAKGARFVVELPAA